MEYQNLLVEIDEGIATVKINRPKALNALNLAVLNELIQVVHEINGNPEIRVVLLTGEGEKAFVAGADIAAMKEMSALEAKKFCELGHHAMHMIENCRKPVIAAVHGFCLGGGLELALACDFIYVSENAKLGLPEVNLGLFPGFGGTQRLSRLIGKNRAKELIYTARIISAEQAMQLGIANRVCAPDALMEEARETAKEIMKKGPIGVELAKRVINQGSDLDLGSGLALEQAAFPLVFATEDQKEGVAAFLEKRPAKFTGK
jgi:enoyl-CoA hydratase